MKGRWEDRERGCPAHHRGCSRVLLPADPSVRRQSPLCSRAQEWCAASTSFVSLRAPVRIDVRGLLLTSPFVRVPAQASGSGVAINDDCITAFFDLKKKRKYRYIVYSILDQKSVILEKTGAPDVRGPNPDVPRSKP